MSEAAVPVTRTPDKNPALAALLSLVIPGAGQLYLGARTAAVSIFGVMLLLAFVVQFTLDNFRVGQVEFGGVTTSWLWLLVAAFWAWNVVDAYQRVQGRASSRLFAFGIPILLIYIVAWQVTDVNLVRLVTRFSDVRIIFNALVHPDLFTRDTIQQSGSTTIWVPCSTPPPTSPPVRVGYPVQINRSCATVGDTIFMIGEGFVPNTTGNIYWLEY